VLRANNLPSSIFFNFDGTVELLNFHCDEQRVQYKDGTAKETIHCQLDAGQTAPDHAVPTVPGAAWTSDFFLQGVPGFAGNPFTVNQQGGPPPLGNANLNFDYPAL